MMSRTATVQRKTRETDITLTLVLDGAGESSIETGIGFFDHMLTLFARHGFFDLTLVCKGDIQVDFHHSVEDVGIVLGTAFLQALENQGPSGFAFQIRGIHQENFPVALFIDTGDDQHRLAANHTILTHLFVPGIHQKIGVGHTGKIPSAKLFHFFIHALTEIGDRAGRKVGSTQSLGYLFDPSGAYSLDDRLHQG